MEKFDIIVKGQLFTISLNSKLYGTQTFVQTNVFRPKDCTERNINPNHPVVPAIMEELDLTQIDEFKFDLANQVRWINMSRERPSSQVFFDACCMACQQHITRHGRLFISDMFTYLDIFSLLLNTCFKQTKDETTRMYRECSKVLGHALNPYIKCPGPYGVMMDFDTWARQKGL